MYETLGLEMKIENTGIWENRMTKMTDNHIMKRKIRWLIDGG